VEGAIPIGLLMHALHQCIARHVNPMDGLALVVQNVFPDNRGTPSEH
jgi:hypothetical protein